MKKTFNKRWPLTGIGLVLVSVCLYFIVEISGPFFTLAGRGLSINVEQGALPITSDVTTRINKGSLTL